MEDCLFCKIVKGDVKSKKVYEISKGIPCGEERKRKT